jgi:DNA repair protein RadC
MYQNQSIKQWVVEDRPREKVLQKGLNALTDSEIIAILLGTGYKEASALALSREILSFVNNDLELLARLSFDDLCNFKGIGEAKAITLLASFELAKRRKLNTSRDLIFNISKTAYDYFVPIIAGLPVEEFHVALLNRRNKLIKTVKISQGGIHSASVDIRLIFKAALDVYATKVILAHNHPSGNISPSDADKDLTSRIVSVGELMQINVLDHIIVTNYGYFSFADSNLI